MRTVIKWVAGLVVVLIAAYCMNTQCNLSPMLKRTPDTVRDTTTKTLKYDVPDVVFLPGSTDTLIRTQYRQRVDTVWRVDSYVDRSVDTPGIIRDYLAKRVYDRQYSDSLLALSWKDTVQRNRITGTGDFSYSIEQRTITETVQSNNTTFTAGAQVHLNQGVEVAPVISVNFRRVRLTGGYSTDGAVIIGIGKAF